MLFPSGKPGKADPHSVPGALGGPGYSFMHTSLGPTGPGP